MITDQNQYDQPGLIETLIQQGETLHAELPNLKTLNDSESIKGKIVVRRRYRTDIKRAKAYLAKKRAELQAWGHALEIADDQQSTDISELEDKKWDAIHGEREAGKPHSTNPELQ